MQIKLGEQLRTLRRRDGRTQEELAQAVGVTAQAVSRWEKETCYPDMGLIPSIANYFGVTIDELFGYQSDRDRKIDAMLQSVEAYQIKSRGDDQWVDPCLNILRGGLAEFPQNERLRLALAETLTEAGWRRHQEWLCYDEEGYLQRDYDRHRENPCWAEAVELCEGLAGQAGDHAIAMQATATLVLLYRNLGETDKAVAWAKRMPELKHCREVLLASAADGKEGAGYIGELLLELAGLFSRQVVYALMSKLSHYESDAAVEKLHGAISLFDLICEDGNLGRHHDEVISLYLYLSRVQWERGYHDEAFDSLDRALEHAKALEALADGVEHPLTGLLVSLAACPPVVCAGVAAALLEDWPFWRSPDFSGVEREIKADLRWEDWARRCRE